MIKKTCIEQIKSVLGKKKTFIPKDTIQTAVCNVADFSSDHVGRQLRLWSSTKQNKKPLLECKLLPMKNKSGEYSHYRLRANSK
jgi:hypothetical protein